MFRINFNEDIFKSITDELNDDSWDVTLDDFIGMASESNEYHCFEILNMNWNGDDLTFTLNDGFDIQFALDQISSYGDYIENEIGEPPMYYIELMNWNDYMGDDATYDYCGSYVSYILSIIYIAMELGYGEEV